jgi:hypothetical protein
MGQRVSKFTHQPAGRVPGLRCTLPDHHVDDPAVLLFDHDPGYEARLAAQPGIDIGIGLQSCRPVGQGHKEG